MTRLGNFLTMHLAYTFVGKWKSHMALEVIKTAIPSLERAHIHHLVDRISADPESQIYVSVPAGPNRDMMASSIARFTTAMADEFPRMTFTVRVAVDDVELQKLAISAAEIENFPGMARIQQLFRHDSIKVNAMEQRESNSVLEAVEAMRTAAIGNDFSHFFVPRDSRLLINRISLGLKHYAQMVDSDNLISADIVRIPGEHNHLTARRAGLEAISYLATKLASMAGKDLFESYLERRGVFSAILDRVHYMKVRMFDDSSKN